MTVPVTHGRALVQAFQTFLLSHRSCQQTLARRKMLSRAPVQAEWERTGAVLGLWWLGLLSVSGSIARGQDPLRWSVAQTRRQVRQALRQATQPRHGRQSLAETLAQAQKDGYRRTGSKKARNWPH